MILTARRLFDGHSRVPFDEPAIEVSDGRIAGVAPRQSSRSDVDTIDFGDATLLPGLIDVHQHLAFDASDSPVDRLQSDDDNTLLLRMRLAAHRALAAGVTTIRDLGDRRYLSLALRDWFRDGPEIGPRILASGPPITAVGGHCWFLGGEADGEAGVRRAVRERVARGVDVIKIMATGGNMTPTVGAHESQFTLSELTVAVDEAHAHGLKIAAHAHGGQGIADSMRAGADSIEHCTFFTADGVDADPDIIDELARRQTAISMTGGIVPGATAHYPAIVERLAAVLANHATLYRAGARIVCGTDAGVGPNKPHDVLPHGISDFLPSIGMTNSQALAAVTSVAADVCGVGDTTGTLAAGMDADILVVAGDVCGDLAAIHRVLAVYVRGSRVPVAT